MHITKILLLLILYFSITNTSVAAEQIILFNAEGYKVSYQIFAERCELECKAHNSPSVQQLLTEGWRVVNTSAKDKTTRIKDYVCVCEGALFVMEKVDPPSNQNQKQIELLQKQIETLEKQNRLLIQENKTLKNKSKNKSSNKQ